MDSQPARIRRLSYRPPASYQLDLEIFSLDELKQRIHARHVDSAHRIEFHLLICITQGEGVHTIDFEPVRFSEGSLLILHPGQAQRFHLGYECKGWLVMFRPEFLFSQQATRETAGLQLASHLEALPGHLRLQERERNIVYGTIAQMYEDTRIDAPAAEVNELLRRQLYALLLRLWLVYGRQDSTLGETPLSLQRFKQFRQLVERHYATWHQVGEYAQHMGCSEKSLSRATMEVVGLTPKAYIVSRINLEAKRLLVHTTTSIAVIGCQVGFDEVTNFVKFFKREVGVSPGEFRRRHVVEFRSWDADGWNVESQAR